MKIRTPKTREDARKYAIEWQEWASGQNLSFGELVIMSNMFEKLAKKFDLTEEFKENGIL